MTQPHVILTRVTTDASSDTARRPQGLRAAATTLVNCYAEEHIDVSCTPTPRGLTVELTMYVAPGFEAVRRAQSRFQQLWPNVPVTWP